MRAQALQLASPTLPTPQEREKEEEVERATRLTELVRSKYVFVWRTLRRLGVSRADVDDAAQEVFLETRRRLEDIREGRETGFLYHACEFVAKRVRRRFARRREAGDDGLVGVVDTRADPEERAQRREAREALQQVLDAMPDEHRAVFLLFEMEQLTTAEIAIALDLPEGTVSSRIYRARRFFERAVQRQTQR